MKKRRFDTEALHGSFEARKHATIVPPLHQGVAYPFESVQHGADAYAAAREGLFCYGRWDNPTVDLFERLLARLEGGEAALATASGMGAIQLITHHLCAVGDEIASSNRIYGGTYMLFDKGLPKGGVKVNWVDDPDDLKSWERAITAKTKFLYVETPSNPSLHITDLSALAGLARAKKIPLIVDNTIATPALQRPIETGTDIVIHSATKYLSGNSTCMSGAIVGSKQLIYDLRKGPMRYLGPALSPFHAWLLLLTIETLSLRMERHSSSALALARFLEKHPKIDSVNYPGLESHPYHALAKRQMTACSSLLSFTLKGSYDDAVKVMERLEIWIHATHLGTSRTIVTHPASTTHIALGEEEQRKAGILPNLIRVSVGLEDPEDLIEDIDQALSVV